MIRTAFNVNVYITNVINFLIDIKIYKKFFILFNYSRVEKGF